MNFMPWRPKSPYLSVLLHSGSGDPLALRIDLKKTYLVVGVLSGVLLALAVGTLLFFRELESNRELQDRLLEVSLKERILHDSIKWNSEAKTPAPLNETAAIPREVTTEAKTESRETGKPETLIAKPAPAAVRARVAEVVTDCASGRCAVRLVLVPASSATVEGSLLVVLETEIPRIGTARATSSSQKRFFIYPGYQTKDELDLKEINRLTGKPFKMSRAVNTNIDFQFGELLRPLAVNVFILDAEKNMVHHERRAIEGGE